MIPSVLIGQVSKWRTDPPKPTTQSQTQSSPSRNDNTSSWRNTPQPQPQLQPQNNKPFIQENRYRPNVRFGSPYYQYGRYGWYYPNYYYWYDPYGFRNRGTVYIYESGKSDTIRRKPTRFSLGIQKSNKMLGGWATIGNDGFVILDYVTTYESDNSTFFPYGTINQVDFPMVSDYVQRKVFYIGAGKTLDYKWKLSLSIGFGNEVIRYRGKDAIGYITFPKYSENFTTVKMGLIRQYKKISGKFDYDLSRKYLSLGIGLNF